MTAAGSHHQPAMAAAGRPRGSAAAPALGLHRRQEPRLSRHHVRDRARRRRHRQHHARNHPRGIRRPRRGNRQHHQGRYHDARRVLDQLAAVGVDFDDVTEQLGREGLTKFEDSWNQLSTTIWPLASTRSRCPASQASSSSWSPGSHGPSPHVHSRKRIRYGQQSNHRTPSRIPEQRHRSNGRSRPRPGRRLGHSREVLELNVRPGAGSWAVQVGRHILHQAHGAGPAQRWPRDAGVPGLRAQLPWTAPVSRHAVASIR